MGNRRHGISADTFSKMIVDSGVVYFNYTSLSEPGTLLGATRGGVSFKRKPTYTELEYEGLTGPVTGSTYLTKEEVTLTVNIVTFDMVNMLLALPGTKADDENIVLDEWDPNKVHMVDNIVLLAEVHGRDDVVMFKLNKPLCTSDFSAGLKDKSELVSTWTFKAYYDSSDLSTVPWEITPLITEFLIEAAPSDEFIVLQNDEKIIIT